MFCRKWLTPKVFVDDQGSAHINDDGFIENAFTLRLVNKSNQPRVFSVTLRESADISLVESPVLISALPEQVLTLPITLRAPKDAVKGKRDIHFDGPGSGLGTAHFTGADLERGRRPDSGRGQLPRLPDHRSA